jgi:predicted NUDIX family NTP pyrophosphohydrolase
MPKRSSAGLLLYRTHAGMLEVLIAHMGGPLWARKDEAAWTIPKGEYKAGEDPLTAARREFAEELGQSAPDGNPAHLGSASQPSGKIVDVWAQENDLDVSEIHSNTFQMQWPPGSGRMMDFPEVDRAGWFDLDHARVKLVKGQVPFLDALERHLGLASV